MATENTLIALLDTPGEAAEAIQELRAASFDPRGVSVAAKDPAAEEHVACYYRSGRDVRYLGQLGGFWNSLWEELSGWAFVAVSGVGPVLVAGPLAEWIARAVENAAIFDGLSGLGAGLYCMGIPKAAIAQCESAIAEGKYLVVAHGPAAEIARARKALSGQMVGAKRQP
ncbi:MAG: hypothetical protein ACE15B_10650 [Bryobacteraceae bacterium]